MAWARMASGAGTNCPQKLDTVASLGRLAKGLLFAMVIQGFTSSTDVSMFRAVPSSVAQSVSRSPSTA